MSLHSYYQDQITACQKEIRGLQNKLNSLAVLRVVLFAWIIWSVYSLVHQYPDGWIFSTIVAVAAFIVSVNIYVRIKDARRLREKLRFVCENELTQLGGAENAFPDGAPWLDSTNYLDDLDIFGPRSLFHLLNRTTTVRGSATLAERLRRSFLIPESILQQQQAIRMLTPQEDIRQLLTATGLVSKEETQRSGLVGGQDLLTARQDSPAAPHDSRESLSTWLNTPPRLERQVLLWIAIGALTLINLYGLYLFFDNGNFTLIIAGIIVSRALTGAWSSYINAQHRLIGHQHALLDQYAGILSVFNRCDTTGSPLLQQIQERTGKASSALKRLSRLSSYFDQRLNLLVNMVLNTLFFYDLLCMIALERWKTSNRAELPVWIDAVGTVETLNSLATFAYNHPEYVYPSPVASGQPAAPPGALPHPIPSANGGLLIETTGLAHPMIPAARRVANDITVGRDQRLILVTGSNMSGKTTFLRTVGVNLLMAQCGLPVCAATFIFTPMQLLTSLRITDSLQEQTSYFMAELNKLQMIVQRLGPGEPALVLIDEILRGTNSEDKTYGSEQFIRRLLQYRCLSFFATHDLTLGQLEQEMPDAISNYCFESIIEGEELHFDYLLRRGVARNRNASFLMRRMDII